MHVKSKNTHLGCSEVLLRFNQNLGFNKAEAIFMCMYVFLFRRVYVVGNKMFVGNDTKTSIVMILIFRTDTSWQTVQIQIGLLLEEQSDPGLHCLLFHLRPFDKIP